MSLRGLGLHTSELELSSVEAVSVDQTLWGRLFGYGRVQIHGAGDDVWSSPLIAAPVQFRREVEFALSASTTRAASDTAHLRTTPLAARQTCCVDTNTR
ncbi:MAG: PH domain-containing protein [Hyphomonadaceae bacterium]